LQFCLIGSIIRCYSRSVEGVRILELLEKQQESFEEKYFKESRWYHGKARPWKLLLISEDGFLFSEKGNNYEKIVGKK